MVKIAQFITLVVMACLWASPLLAEDMRANKETFEGPEYGPPYSYLFSNCKVSLRDQKIKDSYCADVIRSAQYSSLWVLQAMFSYNDPCLKEKKAAQAEMALIPRVSFVASIEDVAKQYVEFVEKGSPPISSLENILIGQDEIMMASSMISNYKNASIPTPVADDMNTKLPWGEPSAWKDDTYDLFKQCSWVEKSRGAWEIFDRSYCNALISGIWIGYAVTQYDPPFYNEGEVCAKERNEYVQAIFRRYNHSEACYLPHRKTNKEIARSFVQMVNSMSAGSAMILQKNGAFLSMLGAINKTCD